MIYLFRKVKTHSLAWFLKIFRQLVHHLHQLSVSHVGFSVVGDRPVAGIDVVIIRCLIDDQIAAHLFTVVIDKNIAHDGDRPGLEIGVRTEFISIGDDPQRRVLIQVFGVGVVPGKLQ